MVISHIERQVREEAWVETNPLRQWRTTNHLSQGGVARLIGASTVSIGKWERGYTTFSSVSEGALANLMGVSVPWLREVWKVWMEGKP